MLSPSSLFSKIIGVLARNGGENGTSIVVVSAVCRSWTWHLFAFMLGWGHLISFSLASVGLGNPFWPLICSLPRHYDLWSFDVKYYQIHCRAADMFKRSWPLQNSNLPLILIWSWFTKTLCSSASCWWCGKHYGPPSIKVTSCRLQLIIQEADLETPFWYLGACMPQW